ANVKITNTDENTSHDIESNGNGDYELLNILPGHYSVTASAAGFETFTATGLLLVSRQTLRIDPELHVGQMTQAVTVEASDAGIIATDTQVIQETFDPQKLLNLPANIRANGNTSPYQLIQVLPGVQADDS